MTTTTTLQAVLRERDNDYDAAVGRVERRLGVRWHQRAAGTAPTPRPLSLSVVIPASNAAYSILRVLDALASSARSLTTSPSAASAASPKPFEFETIVVDDGSADATARLARGHPLRPTVLVLPTRRSAPVARNLGTAVAGGATILYLDADMVLPAHVVGDVATRASDELLVIGFRHNIPYIHDGAPTRPLLPPGEPDLEQDHRVRWRAGPGRLWYSGLTLDRPVEGRPLDATGDLRGLGHGARYYDWDLPRMVVTALLAVPRAAVVEVGGFAPGFADGWGVEDTHLGAKLIAAGLKVVPLRPAVGFHIDPPDADAAWRQKLAVWARNLRLYRRLLGQPPPSAAASARFARHTGQLLRDCKVLR